jgi:hypothetical protein
MVSEFRGVANNTDPTWWKDPCMRKNALFLLVCACASVISGYDGSLFNGLQALPKFFETFPVLAENANILGVTGGVFNFGGLVVPFIVADVSGLPFLQVSPLRDIACGQIWSTPYAARSCLGYHCGSVNSVLLKHSGSLHRSSCHPRVLGMVWPSDCGRCVGRTRTVSRPAGCKKICTLTP